MKCEEIRENLSAYADGELHGEARHKVEAHVRACPACSARLNALLMLQDKLREGLPEVAQAPDIADAVMASLPVTERRAARRSYWRLAWVVPIAAVLIALALMPHPRVSIHQATDRRALVIRPTVRSTAKVSRQPSVRTVKRQSPPAHRRLVAAVVRRKAVRRHVAQLGEDKPAADTVVVTISARALLAAAMEHRVVNPPPDPIVQSAQRPEIMPVVRVERM